MSAHMKKHLTKILIGEKEFKIARKEAKAVLALVESLERSAAGENNSSEKVLRTMVGSRPKGAVYLRGIRSRENISQKQLEGLTGIPVSNISKYESGARKITEAVAKKIAKALKIKAQRLLAE